MIRIRPVLATIAVAALLPVVLAASATAAAPATTLAGRIAVEGQLTDTPSPGGVRVALYAEPPQPFMNKLKPGDRIQGRLVGVATSSPAGAYAITVSDPAAIRSSAFNGVVNFEIWADGHGYWTVFGFVRHVTAGGVLEPLFGPATDRAPMRATLTMARLGKRDASLSPSVMTGDCWVMAPGGDLGPVVAKIEGLWSTIKGVQKNLSYKVGATSSVSIGVDVNDSGWVSGHSGNTSVTETAGEQDYPPTPGKLSRIGQTQMEEGLFNTCQISAEVGTFPFAVNGGVYWKKRKPPKATACVPEPKGSKLHMKRTEAYAFSEGIVLGGTFGIDLAATTGYSKDAEITYIYTSNGYACGTHLKPLRSTARGVVADATVHGNR